MKIDILLGLQWGDEGKGKIVERLYRDVRRFAIPGKFLICI